LITKPIVLLSLALYRPEDGRNVAETHFLDIGNMTPCNRDFFNVVVFDSNKQTLQKLLLSSHVEVRGTKKMQEFQSKTVTLRVDVLTSTSNITCYV
jgi:hypothetical protein